MSLPAQIQAQVDSANLILQDIQAAASADSDVVVVADSGAAPVAVSAVADVSAPQPVSGAPAQPAQTVDVALLQQQFRSLQGMFNSTDRQLREAQGVIQGLREAIATPSAPAGPAPAAATPAQAPVVTPKELEEYTPEFFQMMDRFLAPKLAPIYAAIRQLQDAAGAVQTLQTQVGHLATVSTHSAEERFWSAVTSRVPNLEEVNNSPLFVQWLAQADPMTKLTRQAYLDDARRTLDVDRVATIFNAFIAANAPAGGAVVPTPVPAAAAPSLASQAVPSTRRQAPVPTAAAAEGKVYTKADLEALYRGQREGRWAGKEAEFRAEEAKLVAAINSGRYRA